MMESKPLTEDQIIICSIPDRILLKDEVGKNKILINTWIWEEDVEEAKQIKQQILDGLKALEELTNIVNSEEPQNHISGGYEEYFSIEKWNELLEKWKNKRDLFKEILEKIKC